MQNLSSLQREHLKTLHKKERDKRICDRIKAVLLSDEGWTYRQIAHALLLSDEAVRQHIKEVTAYLTNSKIDMHFFPPYSPNLNLIERLWKLLHETMLNNKYYEKFSEFKEAVLGFLQSLSNPPLEPAQKMKTRLIESFQVIGRKKHASS